MPARTAAATASGWRGSPEHRAQVVVGARVQWEQAQRRQVGNGSVVPQAGPVATLGQHPPYQLPQDRPDLVVATGHHQPMAAVGRLGQRLVGLRRGVDLADRHLGGTQRVGAAQHRHPGPVAGARSHDHHRSFAGHGR
nr:hypothetical protein [Fodinicola feengrottensis]